MKKPIFADHKQVFFFYLVLSYPRDSLTYSMPRTKWDFNWQISYHNLMLNALHYSPIVFKSNFNRGLLNKIDQENNHNFLDISSCCCCCCCFQHCKIHNMTLPHPVILWDYLKSMGTLKNAPNKNISNHFSMLIFCQN